MHSIHPPTPSPRFLPALVTAALLTLSFGTSAADWPNYRGPRHDGVSTEKLPASATTWPAGGPRQVWKTPAPGGFSSFAVADGRAFTLVTRSLDGSPRETLVALDAATGRELWSLSLSSAKYDGGGNSGTPDNNGGDGPRSTPCVDDARVYVLDARLVLVCAEAASGKELWRRDIVAEHAGRNISWQSAASPVIEGDLVLLAGGGEGQALLGIDKVSGKTVWKAENDKMTHATPVVATILGERQVIHFTQSGLVSVRPDSGQLLWRQEFRYTTSTAASPIVAGDIVYCSAGYGVGAGAYRISQEAGVFKSTELWRQPGKLQNHWSTPVYHDGHLYGLFSFKEYGEGPLKCIELASGEEKWSRNGFGQGNVTLVDRHLVALSDDGQLVIAEAKPGAYRELARADILNGKCWSTPTYAGGRVYARSTKEAVCVDLDPSVASTR